MSFCLQKTCSNQFTKDTGQVKLWLERVRDRGLIPDGDSGAQYNLKIIFRGLAVASTRFLATAKMLDSIIEPNPTNMQSSLSALSGLNVLRPGTAPDHLDFLFSMRIYANSPLPSINTMQLTDALAQVGDFWMGLAIILDRDWLDQALSWEEEILTPDSPLLAAPLTRLTGDVMRLYDKSDELFKLLTCNSNVVRQRFYEGASAVYEALNLLTPQRVTILLLWIMFWAAHPMIFRIPSHMRSSREPRTLARRITTN